MEEIGAAAPQMRPGEIRDYLARFLFTGEDVFKTVNLLSGGERGRLALAVLALGNANLLLLDEPTNHLDLPSQEILQAVLAGYAGTILLVSHDRYLIDGLATQIWEVLPEQGRLRLFDGDYSEYRQALQAEAEASKQVDSEAPSRQAAKPSQQRPGRATNKERERQQRILDLESEIHALEEQLAQVSRALENPSADAFQVQKLGQEYVRLQQVLETRMVEWVELVRDS
jgi:ATP-binding cassette subfamily F protein 3